MIEQSSKLDIVQAKEIEFRPYFWWSDWIDVLVFDQENSPFLLQMKVSRFNKKKFKTISIMGAAHLLTNYKRLNHKDIESLSPLTREKANASS